VRKSTDTPQSQNALRSKGAVIILACVTGGYKSSLARQYIIIHRSQLPGGIFWFQSQLEPGVRAKPLDISLRVCLKNPERNVLPSQFLRTWLCRSHYNITGRARITRDLPLATHTGRSWSREDVFLLRFLGPRAHAGAHTGWLKVSRLIGFWTPRQCSVQYHLLALLIAYRKRPSSCPVQKRLFSRPEGAVTSLNDV